ncbi:hypothetical protein LP419_36945 [Massilia sp. H-1]|nr:hypothetical protein LP419_36945 [Massilia sp. H-1]
MKHPAPFPRRQRGAVLVVGMIVLMLITLMVAKRLQVQHLQPAIGRQCAVAQRGDRLGQQGHRASAVGLEFRQHPVGRPYRNRHRQ